MCDRLISYVYCNRNVNSLTGTVCLEIPLINTTSRTASCGKKGCINIWPKKPIGMSTILSNVFWPITNFTNFTITNFTLVLFSRLQAFPKVLDRLQFQFYKEVQMKGKPKPIPVWFLTRSRHKPFSKVAHRWKRFGAGSKKSEHLPTVRISSAVTSLVKPEIFQTTFVKSNCSSYDCTKTKSSVCTLL